MNIVGQEVLGKFSRKHTDARAWIAAWVAAVQAAAWQNIDEVRRVYRHADGVRLKSGNVVTVFNCKGNEHRLLTYVAYPAHIVQVLEVLTHAEYSKDSWKERY